MLAAVVGLSCAIGWHGQAAAQSKMLVYNPPPPNIAQGSTQLLPGGGFDASITNFKPYALPGQAEDPGKNPCNGQVQYIPGDPFVLSYANSSQHVQSSDWWSSMAFQLQGWVNARGGIVNCVDTGDPLANTQTFSSEPFQFQFLDFNPKLFGSFPPEAGLALWNQNNFQIANNAKVFDYPKMGPPVLLGYNTNFDLVGWGNSGPVTQARVTVGLDGVHPLREDEFPVGGPKSPPWTNILVQSYSDWGLVTSYHDKDNTNQLNITMANGSPFVWFERVKGTAPFDVWVGGVPSPPVQGTYSLVVPNTGSVMIVSVTTNYVPNYSPPNTTPIQSTSYYAIWADRGTWVQNATTNGNSLAQYQNSTATAVIVTALPHNVGDVDPTTAWNLMKPYACRKTVKTQLMLPTPAKKVTVNGQSVNLGYSPANATVTGELLVVNQMLSAFGSQCSAGNSYQLIFPHHRKVLVAAQKSQIVTGSKAPVWNSLLGPALGYVGNTMFLQHATRGVMSMLPSIAIDKTSIVNPNDPAQTAAEDIYDTLKTWFFLEEPSKPGCVPGPGGCMPVPLNLNSFPRNPTTYMSTGSNTYINFTTTLREQLVVADQLAQTSNPKIKGVMDPQLGETKDQAAAEMRDLILRTLEEMVGQWGDVFTANLLEYNPEYSTIYGYPDGFGAVGHLADHHYHYGYFLRAAAAIGRYDPAWLQRHLPIIKSLLLDVAAFDNGASGFPQLRNFNPYYGHSWADGAAYGGNNQESTSEAISFEIGMVELGELLNNAQWRDLGQYLYEQEILAVEQYWLNQDASLTDIPSDPESACPTGAPFSAVKSMPPVCYNGNWPRAFVTYKRDADGSTQRHTLISRVFNDQLSRTTFFDGSPLAAYTIEAIPAGPSIVYLARNLPWLQATWQQLISDDGFYQSQPDLKPTKLGVYQDVAATMQALLPASGSDLSGTGLAAALARINPLHPYFPAAMNTEAKYIAYTISALGALNGSYTVTTPSGGAFGSGSSTAFVAYNPTGAPTSVTFNGTSKAGPFTIPAGTEQTYVGGSLASSFHPGAISPPSNRLYFRKGGTLNPTAGSAVVPASGTYDFPTDKSALASTFVTIPVRSDVATNQQQFPAPSNLSDIVTFAGRFSGSLIGAPPDSCKKLYPNGPVVCDPVAGLQSVTRFALYQDECLTPGWQNCSFMDSKGNNYNMLVSYYFDTSTCDPITGKGMPCNANREEFYGGIPTGPGVNSWALANESNEYYFAGVNLGVPGPEVFTSGFNGSFGLNVKGLPKPSCGGLPDDGSQYPFFDPLKQLPPAPCVQMPPGQVPYGMFWQDVANGAAVVQLWGGVQVAGNKAAPIPLSVDAAAITGRASWFEPPYVSGTIPTPTRTLTGPTATGTPTGRPTPLSTTAQNLAATSPPTPRPSATLKPIATPPPTPKPRATRTPPPTATPTPTPTGTQSLPTDDTDASASRRNRGDVDRRRQSKATNRHGETGRLVSRRGQTSSRSHAIGQSAR
jgi:Glycosyl hydrolase family 81 C-terminal domain